MKPKGKLSHDDVRLIRALGREHARLTRELSAVTHTAIGEKFGVTRDAVAKIIGYRTWRDVRD